MGCYYTRRDEGTRHIKNDHPGFGQHASLKTDPWAQRHLVNVPSSQLMKGSELPNLSE